MQSNSERQRLENEVCQLEKKLMALEEAKRDLHSRKMASDQILQSHDATVADLRLRLDKANAEKVGFGTFRLDIWGIIGSWSRKTSKSGHLRHQ